MKISLEILGLSSKRSSLVAKLSLLVTFSVLLILTILGFYFDDFLRERSYDETRQRMQHGYQRLAYNLKNIEQELHEGIAFIKTDERMIASIELINNYQDKKHYNTPLIDEEKKLIAEQLLSRVKLSFNDDIALYDHNAELIAYVVKDKAWYQLNFISFDEGEPRIYRRNEQQSGYNLVQPDRNDGIYSILRREFHATSDVRAGSVITHHRIGHDLVFKSHQTLFREGSEKSIAHIEMSKILGSGYFEQLSRDFGLDIGVSFDAQYQNRAKPLNGSWEVPDLNVTETDQEYLCALKKEIRNGAVYFIARLDKAALNTALDDNRKHFLALLIFVAINTLLLMRYVIRHSVKRPITALMAQIRKIEGQDYSSSNPVATGDELEEISLNINHLAQAVQEREHLLEQSRIEQEYLSYHDALTNLPNRRFFSRRLQQALDSAKLNDSKLAILFLDLDQFKLVNDTLGHDVGDKLLVQVAERLRPLGNTNQILARIGGDEFIILIEDVQDDAQLKAAAENYLALFQTPLLCTGLELGISASIGVALYPKDGLDSVTLVKHADLAMYRSKDKGRNNYSYYSEDLADLMQKRADMTQALKLAIEAGDQFELYYQPKIDIASGLIHAIEALIRWNCPGCGLVRPDQFITLAEETGLIIPIGQWVLHQGCRDFVQLGREGIVLDHVSMNVSNVQLRNDGMMAVLGDAIAASGILPTQIELEITESYIASDVSNAIQKLQAFRDMGISLAIDDFGTGYSSMSYLKRLPVTRVKIDKSFVDGLPQNQDSVTLTRAVIALAKNFGLAITAEGVELEEQRLFLEQEHCDEIQGYLYAKPMPLEEFREYCRVHASLLIPTVRDNIIHLPGTAHK